MGCDSQSTGVAGSHLLSIHWLGTCLALSGDFSSYLLDSFLPDMYNEIALIGRALPRFVESPFVFRVCVHPHNPRTPTFFFFFATFPKIIQDMSNLLRFSEVESLTSPDVYQFDNHVAANDTRICTTFFMWWHV